MKQRPATSHAAIPKCGCDRPMMAAMSPLHPHRYLDLACDEHRAEFVAGNPTFTEYADRLEPRP